VLGDFHLLHLLSEGGTVSVQIMRLATRCNTGDKGLIGASASWNFRISRC
jgi:hypothetical protein